MVIIKKGIRRLFLVKIVVLVFISVFFFEILRSPKTRQEINETLPNNINISLISPSSSPTLTPTPKPLTFSEMQKLYGPCTLTPVLMYHHIQTEDNAKLNHQTSLSVYTDYFEKQIVYLKEKNYQTITMDQLIGFFLRGEKLPPKSIILTFDDGYQDFYSDAYPILKKYSLKATVFLPTGLMNNPGYLNWNEIQEMNGSGFINFANHTWSHHSTAGDKATVEKEISTADSQLSERGLNSSKTFAYPYGSDTKFVETYLNSINYNLAFTTRFGKVLCLKQKLSLPRVRVGNINLQNYGI